METLDWVGPTILHIHIQYQQTLLYCWDDLDIAHSNHTENEASEIIIDINLFTPYPDWQDSQSNDQLWDYCELFGDKISF